MDTWYSLSLGDGVTAAIPSAEIEERFKQLFASAEKPTEMAVFTRPESEGRLHCEVIAYFSPAAAEIAKEFQAQPCGKPFRAELSLLAGDEQVWSILFPTGTINA
ncbi:MAG: hypothetical protein DCC56_11715 [Anaerolineae bacterium]|nr:hypothetical protein [Anaerolineales bacterium]RIK29692.1 MAG: hypothetical protein DCC56_11715 [Anaerolineae bacterium]WKZ42384.1 MAG: hypothetical protein QY302_09780 [Anaerolineales bacterium]WKZ48719.1 MAG: hypothetical protein QY306_05025 [Anaerolineales bacterium]